MTVLAAIKKAVLRASGAVIDDVFGSSDQVAIEMGDLANEVAADIAVSHSWRALTKVHSLPGGSGEYDLPTDYDRMLIASGVSSAPSNPWGFVALDNIDDWTALKDGTLPAISPGGWIIFGGQMHFQPAPSGGASFAYISTQWARSESGTPKAEFDANDDTFVLSDRLLTLGLLWRWKAQKGLDYSEDMATYELALAQEQVRDRGTFALRQPRGIRSQIATTYTGRDWP